MKLSSVSSIRAISAAVVLALATSASAQSDADQGIQLSRANDSKIDFSTLAHDMSYDQVIVYFDSQSEAAKSDAALAVQIANAGASAGLKLDYVRTLSTGGHLLKIASTSANEKDARKSASVEVNDQTTETAMRALANLPDVTSVEPDFMLQALYTPNDTDYAGRQWHYFEATGGLNLPTAWDKATGTGVPLL